jgi:hypothetical protein
VGIPVLSRQGDPDPRMTRDRERARYRCKGRCGYFDAAEPAPNDYGTVK